MQFLWGLAGSGICASLAAKGYKVRAMVRAPSNPDRVNALKGLGIELVTGDLRDPSSLQTACAGMEAVITTVSSMPFSYQPGNDIQSVDLDGDTSLIAAAKEAGVRQFVYTSFTGNITRSFPLGDAKRTVEQRVKMSGMMYTILRPGYFMEVWLSPAVGFDAANAKATIYGTGDQQISWIAVQDVVAFAVAALENPSACNAIIEMGGPAAVSPNRVIALFEKNTGRKFEVVQVPPEALQQQFDQATDPMQKSFAALMLSYAKGDPIEMKETARTFGIQLKSIEQFVQGAA
ncbi:MAG: SDR family oxidoreductase [Chloroflexi bacterium]|nr:SDR family oxidoreductase [Chloroflexota bacterium]